MYERMIVSPEDPLAWLREEFRSRPLTGLLFEKGPWCPWCVHEVKQWMGQLQRLQGLGGALYIVTAQSQEMLVESPADWGRPEVPVICDEENVLAKTLGIGVEKKAPLPSLQPIYDSYKSGVNQVGFVFFDQSGKEVVGWGAVSTDHNLGGSLDRPVPDQVLFFMETKLDIHKRRANPRVHNSKTGVNQTVQVKPSLPTLVEDVVFDVDSIELDGYEQIVERVYDDLPQDLQALVLREKRLPPMSIKLTTET